MNGTHLFVIISTLVVGACGGESMSRPSESAPHASARAKSDIVETAAGAGQFSTLVAAVKAADLEATLRGTGPFTVFAPTDEAFAKLPKGTLDSLLKPENKAKLQAILTFHVVPGKVMSPEASKLSSARTAQGQDVRLDSSSGTLKVGGANVIQADINASNGVIHVIDTVIIPE